MVIISCHWMNKLSNIMFLSSAFGHRLGLECLGQALLIGQEQLSNLKFYKTVNKR